MQEINSPRLDFDRDLDSFDSQRKFVYELNANKNFFSCKKIIIILFYYSCVNFSILPLRILYFPCYVKVFLDFKLERIFFLLKNGKIQKIFQSILCQMDKWNLFLITNVLLFDAVTILIHHFVLFFSTLSQKVSLFFLLF